MAKEKVKVGFFSLSCCEGCELAVLDLEETLLKAFKQIEIVQSRLLMEKAKPLARKLDIAFVEGSVVSSHDLDKLHYIREKANFLVAMGACAAIAGIPGIRNTLPSGIQERLRQGAIKPVRKKVYPISAFVEVDYTLHGCSINEQEFLDFLNKYLHGVKPRLHEVPVCFECKLRENSCLLLRGIACLGPLTYAGCSALCPSENAQCIGCRGFTRDANFRTLDNLFEEIGLSKRERFDLFTYFNPQPKELKGKLREEE